MQILKPFPLLTALTLAGFASTTTYGQNVFVSNYGAGTVSEYDASGNLVNAAFASGLHGPEGLAFNSSGDLYVSNTGNNTVSEFDSSGNLINTFTSYGAGDLTLDSSGNVYLTAGSGVDEYSAGGTLLNASFVSGLHDAAGLAFGSGGNLYVSDNSTFTVSEYDPVGNVINASFVSGLNGAWGLAFDHSGNLYVVEPGGGAVGKYDSSGNLITANFVSGFGLPAGVAFNYSGDLYVADYLNNRVFEYNASGNLIHTISGASLNEPVFIAVQPVPEPVTWALLATGTIAFRGWRRRSVPSQS